MPKNVQTQLLPILDELGFSTDFPPISARFPTDFLPISYRFQCIYQIFESNRQNQYRSVILSRQFCLFDSNIW